MPVADVANRMLVEELQTAREQSDRLFAILRPEAYYERPIAERHRVIFYVGHLDGFDAIQICREGLGIQSADPDLDALFQAGIDPDSAHLPADSRSDWPALEQVKAYADRCRKSVDESLERAPEDVAQMALEHRLMHLETLAYMFHNFGYELKKSHQREKEIARATSHKIEGDAWREIPAGEAVLGKVHDETFGWDNEYDRLRRFVPAFHIQRKKITNADYLRFVAAGAPKPHFWVERGRSMMYRGMFEEIPLPLDWPVYVTKLEAEAYANWLGKRLPTEEEFDRAAYGTSWGFRKASIRATVSLGK